MVDLAGFPKDRYYLYQSVWTKTPMVHVLPHWNWEGHEGEKVPVICYSNADEVELFLNGKSLGRKRRVDEEVTIPVGANVSPDKKFTSKYRMLWEVPFERGELKAVAYREGRQSVIDTVRTAGAPARIKLLPDRSSIAGDGEDLSFITVRIEDKDGNLCPSADLKIDFALRGPGEIRAVDNGNPATVEPFQANSRTTFNGLALVIVRAKAAASGPVQVSATSGALTVGTARILLR
jgi:beta-galactosidase